MSLLTFHRVNELPAELMPSAIYFVTASATATQGDVSISHTDLVEVYLTDTTGSQVRKIPTFADLFGAAALADVLHAQNATTADKLKTARKINGVNFDGSADITITAADSIARIPVSEKGTAGGVATLGQDGIIPSSQLPSYVDRVVEAANMAALPAQGIASVIYITKDNNKVYRWGETGYVEISAALLSAETAMRLATARKITSTGDVLLDVTFDGSADTAGTASLSNTGVVAGDYAVVTVDAKGRVKQGRILQESDIPTIPVSKVIGASAQTDYSTEAAARAAADTALSARIAAVEARSQFGFMVWYAGVPAASQVLSSFASPFAFTIPANMTTSKAREASVAAFAKTTFVLKINAVDAGTIEYAQGAKVPTFTTKDSLPVTVPAGAVVEVIAPATPDSALAGVGLSIMGNR